MRYNFTKIYKDGTATTKQLNYRSELYYEISKTPYETYQPCKITITTKAGNDITAKVFNDYLGEW